MKKFLIHYPGVRPCESMIPADDADDCAYFFVIFINLDTQNRPETYRIVSRDETNLVGLKNRYNFTKTDRKPHTFHLIIWLI